MDQDREVLYENLNYSNFLQFYNSFDSVIELMEFLRTRERADVRIFPIMSEDRSEISAVIPTKSIESKFVKTLSEKLQGINIIFVESEGPFFNFSYSMNTGIREAIRRNSKFIMLSNDDIFPLNGIRKLRDEVAANSEKYDIFIPTVFSGKEYLSSKQKVYGQSRFTEHIISNRFVSWINPSNISKSSRKLITKLKIYNDPRVLKYIIIRDNDLIFRKYTNFPHEKIMEYVVGKFNKLLVEMNNVQPVSIIRADLLRLEKFDESFVNGGEDTDLSIRLAINGAKVYYLKEQFQNVGGYSLGKNIDRILKNTLPEILITGYKLNQYFQDKVLSSY